MSVAPSATETTTPRLAGPVATTVALGVATVYTYVRSPFETGAFPICLLYAGTGVYCPGCGGLRAVHTLLHGDFAGALSLNALAILVFIPAVVIALVWWAGSAMGRDWPPPRAHPAVWWGVAGVVLVFTVLRNVGPLAPYLAP